MSNHSQEDQEPIKYFVSYAFTGGFGNTVVESPSKLSNIDLKELSDLIKDESGQEEIVILYFKEIEA